MPTLHLPDHTRPFFLFAHSNQEQALGLLCQRTGDTWAPKAYLSKQLDMLTKGWPPCIQAMAAIAALVPKANKLSRHAPLTVCSLHTFRDLLSHRAFLSLPPSRVQVLHAFLLNPQLSFSPCSPLNPASLLPTSSKTDSLRYSCSLTVDLERLFLNYKNTLGFLAPRGEEFNTGPETRLDRSELLCNKVLLKYKGDRESF